MGVTQEIIYRCDSCKKQRDDKWEWLGFKRPNVGQYYLPTSAIFCNRDCVNNWLQNFANAQVSTVKPEYNGAK
jgi:hypothetical protein